MTFRPLRFSALIAVLVSYEVDSNLERRLTWPQFELAT